MSLSNEGSWESGGRAVALPDSVEDRGRGQKRDGKRKEGGEDMSGITKGGVSSEEHVAEMGDGHSEAGKGRGEGRVERERREAREASERIEKEATRTKDGHRRKEKAKKEEKKGYDKGEEKDKKSKKKHKDTEKETAKKEKKDCDEGEEKNKKSKKKHKDTEKETAKKEKRKDDDKGEEKEKKSKRKHKHKEKEKGEKEKKRDEDNEREEAKKEQKDEDNREEKAKKENEQDGDQAEQKVKKEEKKLKETEEESIKAEKSSANKEKDENIKKTKDSSSPTDSKISQSPSSSERSLTLEEQKNRLKQTLSFSLKGKKAQAPSAVSKFRQAAKKEKELLNKRLGIFPDAPLPSPSSRKTSAPPARNAPVSSSSPHERKRCPSPSLPAASSETGKGKGRAPPSSPRDQHRESPTNPTQPPSSSSSKADHSTGSSSSSLPREIQTQRQGQVQPGRGQVGVQERVTRGPVALPLCETDRGKGGERKSASAKAKRPFTETEKEDSPSPSFSSSSHSSPVLHGRTEGNAPKRPKPSPREPSPSHPHPPAGSAASPTSGRASKIPQQQQQQTLPLDQTLKKKERVPLSASLPRISPFAPSSPSSSASSAHSDPHRKMTTQTHQRHTTQQKASASTRADERKIRSPQPRLEAHSQNGRVPAAARKGGNGRYPPSSSPSSSSSSSSPFSSSTSAFRVRREQRPREGRGVKEEEEHGHAPPQGRQREGGSNASAPPGNGNRVTGHQQQEAPVSRLPPAPVPLISVRCPSDSLSLLGDEQMPVEGGRSSSWCGHKHSSSSLGAPLSPSSSLLGETRKRKRAEGSVEADDSVLGFLSPERERQRSTRPRCPPAGMRGVRLQSLPWVVLPVPPGWVGEEGPWTVRGLFEEVQEGGGEVKGTTVRGKETKRSPESLTWLSECTTRDEFCLDRVLDILCTEK